MPCHGLTDQELAAELRCSQRTIHRPMDRGMPYHHIGRLLRFDLNDVMTWLKRRETPAAPDDTQASEHP